MINEKQVNNAIGPGKKPDYSSRSLSNKALIALLGTVVEYYDYSLYGFSAAILATKFFPQHDNITAMMYVFAVYAVSYFTKPLGSLVFGVIGDKLGRVIALKLTIIGMAVPTFLIGLLPDNQRAGLLAPLILLMCRLLQGFFVGGEYDGAAIYIIEHFKQRPYTGSALTRMTGVLGLLLGVAVTNLCNSSLFPEWGWRIPFVLALPLASITYYYRKFLDETPDFLNVRMKASSYNFVFSLKQHWLTIFKIVLLAGGFGATYQIAIIFMKQYLPMVLPQSKTVMSSFSVVLVFSFGIAMPIAGILADRYGEKVIYYSTWIVMIFNALLMLALQYQVLNLALLSSVGIAVGVAPFNCLAHGIIINTLPVAERYKCIGIGHALGSMLMSGSAGYICLSVMRNFNFRLFPIMYMSLFSLIACLAIYLLKSNRTY